MHVLENPVWHALTGPQATVAEGRGRATRYDQAVAPFTALPDDASQVDWDDLRDLIGPDDPAVLFQPSVVVPAGWEVLVRVPTVQMIAESVEPADFPMAVTLGPADVDDMQKLVERTRPGPFLARTIELGRYIGIRDGGMLVAMAGERMRLRGYVELSAVCTDPAYRRRGWAAALVRDLVESVSATGDAPMLHVVADNTTAISLYEKLGFALARTMEVVVARPRSRANEA